MKEKSYLSTPDNLFPKPLQAEEEARLLKKLSTDPEVKDILITRNMRLVVHITKKFCNTEVDFEDLVSIGTIGLIKAINSFSLDKKTKLATYASRCIENEILMSLRKSKKARYEISLDDVISTDNDGNELTLANLIPDSKADKDFNFYQRWEEISYILNYVLNVFSDRELIILFGKILGKQTQKEIARKLHISQSYVSRLQKKIRKKLHDISEKNKDFLVKNAMFSIIDDEFCCFDFFKEYLSDEIFNSFLLDIGSILISQSILTYDTSNNFYIRIKIPLSNLHEDIFAFIAELINYIYLSSSLSK